MTAVVGFLRTRCLSITDLEFEPATGNLVALCTTAGEVRGQRLVDVGSYAAIVRPD